MRLFITLLLSLSVIFSSAISFANEEANTSTTAKHTLKVTPEVNGPSSDRFPGDPASHKVVYMFNKSDAEYQTHILNSIQAMIQLYGDDVQVAVVAIGPGIHVLAKKPMRKVDPLIYQRVESFAKDYNVRWIACGNTMKTIGWTDADIRPFAEYAQVGAAALMVLQEKGYKLLVW
ncbi:DsrE family protein [Thiomicrorhabdus sp. Milos-T2]|uniref:DsrE family protein n=1 Tax=Thiomicrorhabdus sp. Milos-T2 TaxID=90814 RepID=UPI000493B611|nr:DsrE family protein [Thiomicrorhabdus sp. Milos-T2]